MSILDKFKRKPLPTVPDDRSALEEEQIKASIRLNEAVELKNRASEVVDSLHGHNTVNHYAQRLRDTYAVALAHEGKS